MEPTTMYVIGTTVMTLSTWFNQHLSRRQRAQFHDQQRVLQEQPYHLERRREVLEWQLKYDQAVRDEQHRNRNQEELIRAKLHNDHSIGGDPLLPGTWWDSRRPRGSGPVVVVNIGPRTHNPPLSTPTTLDVPMDFLAHSLKKEHAGDFGFRVDVFSDRLGIDNDGTARGFAYGELRDRPAIIVFGKASGNYIYVNAVFSQTLTDPNLRGAVRVENLAVFPRGFLSEMATELGVKGPRIFEVFDMVCETVVNTKVLNLLDIHLTLTDGAYAPRAHEFFLQRKGHLADLGLWPKSNPGLQELERRMQAYPEELRQLRESHATPDGNLVPQRSLPNPGTRIVKVGDYNPDRGPWDDFGGGLPS